VLNFRVGLSRDKGCDDLPVGRTRDAKKVAGTQSGADILCLPLMASPVPKPTPVGSEHFLSRDQGHFSGRNMWLY
jgi:hypothetical protein